MNKLWKSIIVGAAVIACTASVAPAQTCGDLNGDGSRTIADALFLSNCLGLGSCPAASATNDLYKDTVLDNADLAVLVDTLAGLETLYDPCTGPGADIACGGGTVTLGSVAITSSQTWPNTCTVQLGGTVTVETPAGQPTTVLRIEAGSTVQGVKGSLDPATLIILPGAKVDFQGTPSSPIVFTSDQPAGSRGLGDWAGVLLNGRSTVNRPNCLANAEGVPSAFGGCEATDSTGIARYVRVEFCGLEFTPNNELNVWTMNGLGSGTVFDHIQAHAGKDDCHEWFGGTINEHHLVASACADDGLDWQLGTTTSVQYALMLQAGDLTDANKRDSRALEGDNSEYGNDDLPRSNPKFCNLTAVATYNLGGDNGGSDSGLLFRRGTAGQVMNAIVTGFHDAGAELRDVATTQQACTNPTTLAGNLVVQDSIFFDNGDANVSCTGAGTAAGGETVACCTGPGTGTCVANEQCKSGTISGGNCSTCEWYTQLVASQNVLNANGAAETMNPGQSTNWPASGNLYSAKPTGTLPAAGDCSEISDSFEDSGYVGAFDPTGPTDGWLSQPWISFDKN